MKKTINADDPDVQNLLDSFQISANEIPVLICRGQLVLRKPSNQQIADCLGFNESIDQTQVRDLVVIGAGPSGLAASEYMAPPKDLMFWSWRQVHRWSGRFKLKDRKLFRISHRDFRSRACGSVEDWYP